MFRNTLVAAALSVAYGGMALAAVTAEEAKQLGTTLTPIGAEKAGNKDGTIPEWTGGLTTPPAGFVKGSGFRPDPFAADKPRLTIDAKNVAQHADKLTMGMQELIKRNPGTYRIDVYPTRRPVTYPKRLLDNAAKNAVTAKTADGGLSVEGAIPGVPFPIAKTGHEVMWNHLLRFTGNTLLSQVRQRGTSTRPACRRWRPSASRGRNTRSTSATRPMRSRAPTPTSGSS